MLDSERRTTHIVDTDQLYKDIKNGKLPAVSFVKPSGRVDGHSASSKWDLFDRDLERCWPSSLGGFGEIRPERATL